jgi:hypothetical protein
MQEQATYYLNYYQHLMSSSGTWIVGHTTGIAYGPEDWDLLEFDSGEYRDYFSQLQAVHLSERP